jgi:hypothetical protein
VNELARALERLDALLLSALPANEAATAAAGDRRALFVDAEEAARLVGASGQQPQPSSALLEPDSFGRWRKLQDAFGLDQLELDMLVIAIAPDVDLRYERIYAFLQDDLTRRRAMVDLTINLLCRTEPERLDARRRYGPAGRLVPLGLVTLEPGEDVSPPLLAHTVAPTPTLVRWLHGDDSLDHRLVPSCRLRLLAELAPREEAAAFARWAATERRSRIAIVSRDPDAVRGAVDAIGRELATSVLEFSPQGLAPNEPSDQSVRELVLAGHLHEAVAVVTAYEELAPDRRTVLTRALDELGTPVVFMLERRWPADSWAPAGLVELELEEQPAAIARQRWASAFTQAGVDAGSDALDLLGGQFPCHDAQVAAAISGAAARAGWLGREPVATVEDVLSVARSRSHIEAGGLVRRLPRPYKWDDIVLPEDQLEQLREICNHARHRARVLNGWGFKRAFGIGTGLSVLFAGPPGTGKTMAAQVLAHELGVELFRADLSQIADKYVGEAEKRLERIFTAAERTSAVLFFDEAEALFGKRSETKDAQDRYANIEVAYLLQRLETFDGVAVLATNLRTNVDSAFIRRLAYAVEFQAPSVDLRLEIWRRVWPREARLDTELDLVHIAGEFELPGGHIRNIALNAAHLAAADGSAVTTEHVLRATRREYQKLGQLAPGLRFEAHAEAAA